MPGQPLLRDLHSYGFLTSPYVHTDPPDDRYPTDCFSHIINNIDINNFEVIQSTGPTGGPRSPGAPVVKAGANKQIAIGTSSSGVTVNLNGNVSGSGALSIRWKLVTGPATVVFGTAATASTTATFTAPGKYTLMLSATDEVHAVAYDATVITVTP